MQLLWIRVGTGMKGVCWILNHFCCSRMASPPLIVVVTGCLIPHWHCVKSITLWWLNTSPCVLMSPPCSCRLYTGVSIHPCMAYGSHVWGTSVLSVYASSSQESMQHSPNYCTCTVLVVGNVVVTFTSSSYWWREDELCENSFNRVTHLN